MRTLSKSNLYLLCILLIILTASLLLWPVNYHYKYEAVQSLSALHNPALFGCIFTIWFIILLVMARQGSLWWNAFLICIFGLVYVGFWLVNSPYISGGSFDPSGVSYTKYILEHGHITMGVPKWGYFEFPITPIFGAICSHITGLVVFSTAKALLTFGTILFTFSLYIFLLKSIGDPWKSFLGVLIAMLGCIHLIALDFFRPGTLGLLYIAPLLILIGLHKDRIGKSAAEAFLLILILFTVCMTHFMSSVEFLFVLLGIYVYKRFKKTELAINFRIIIIAAILYLTWWIFVSVFTSNFVLKSGEAFLSNPSGISVFFAFMRAKALVGEQVPVWASAVRLFWIILLYALPVLITVKLIFRSAPSERKSLSLGKSTGALLGIALLTIIMIPLDMGANRSFEQFFRFGMFFTPLILLKFLDVTENKFFSKIGKRVFGFLPVILIFLAFPTFLAHQPSVNTQIYYNKEHSAFAFLQANYNQDVNVSIFCDVGTGLLQSYYLPEANRYLVPYAPEYVKDKAEFLEKLPAYIEGFVNSKGKSFFIYSPRITHYPYLQLGLPEDDPIWAETLETLNSKNKIYDNGFNWIAGGYY